MKWRGMMKWSIRKPAAWLLMVALLAGGAVTLSGTGRVRGAKETQEETASYECMNGKKIGIMTGSNYLPLVEKALPDAEILFYNSVTDLITALKTRKIDAFPEDEPAIRYMMMEEDEISYIGEYLDEFSYGYAFPKTEEGKQLCDEVSAFMRSIKEDGTLKEIDEKWFGTDDALKVIEDYSGLAATKGTIHMATDAEYPPFEYMKDGRLVGYDIDIIVQFCKEYGYALEVNDMSLDGVLSSVQSGKSELGGSALTITQERAESVWFSESNYTGGMVLVVRASDPAAVPRDNGTGGQKLADLNGKRIGVQTGTTFDEYVLGTLPDAKISYFNTYSDMAVALKTDKIDGFPGDEPVLRLMSAEDPDLVLLEEYMDNFDFGAVFPKTDKGDALRAEMDEYFTKIRQSGELEEITYKWIKGPDSEKTVPDYSAFAAEKGTLTMATEGAYAPMNYYRGEELVGLEIDLAAHFCEAYGYGLTIDAMNFDGILPAVQSGKADFGMAGMTITDERKESANFSVPYYTGGTMMMVRRVSGASDGEKQGFIAKMKLSFQKTFLREGRWKLFVEGVRNTLVITLLSILFGTILGFLVFMMCRNGNVIANGITRFCMWLVQGMPVLVLLMILYYIIFGSMAISGIVVSVIGFTLTFGAATFGMLRMGVGAVDNGQYEAAYALGYSNTRTFFKIIFPQALPHIMPAFKSEIVSLIKATAIVGYIAVQDLTKMGDIVRSRTYEAFFPLIAVTVIYFVLEGIIGALVDRLEILINPKRRKRDSILKGVKTDD